MVMATIYTIVGEYEEAIDKLEMLLSIPSWCSAKYLMADPLFVPLHNHKRFIALVDEYTTAGSEH